MLLSTGAGVGRKAGCHVGDGLPSLAGDKPFAPHPETASSPPKSYCFIGQPEHLGNAIRNRIK